MIQQHINDLKLVDQTLDEDDYKSDGETRQRIDRVIDYLQNSVNTNVLSSREKVVYECRSSLLKHLFPVTHTNGYPCEAVPKATILSLPQLMGVPDSPIT